MKVEVAVLGFPVPNKLCVCVCVCACVRACMRMWDLSVHACVQLTLWCNYVSHDAIPSERLGQS